MNEGRGASRYSGTLALAARIIRKGGLVAYPTESCYGIGCDPNNPIAIKRLLNLKQRPASKGLILLAANDRQLQFFVPGLDKDILKTWPGPQTWLVQAKKTVPYWVRGKHKTVAVRVTAHELANKLCRATGFAIISTSANRSGTRPARTYREVRSRLGKGIDYVLPGKIGRLKKPTPINDAKTKATIRP